MAEVGVKEILVASVEVAVEKENKNISQLAA